MSRKVRELLVNWRGQMGQYTALEMWKLAPLCLMWGIWREQNARSFENRKTATLEWKKMLL